MTQDQVFESLLSAAQRFAQIRADLGAVVDVFDGRRSENCLSCKRTLVYNMIYADQLYDGPTLCHSCKAKRNARITAGGNA